MVSDLSTPEAPLSPSNPNFLLQPSPPPTRQVLNDVSSKLRLVETVQNILPNWKQLEGHSAEETVEGIIAEADDNLKVGDNNSVDMPDEVDIAAVDFQDENGKDGAKAIEFTRTLKVEYDPTEVDFWFIQIENEMYTCEVKSQWLKRCVLVKNLPPKVQADVKQWLLVKQSDAPADIYKQIKQEVLRLHAPKEEETYKKALSRVLTGLPSQLGQQLLHDVCTKTQKLSCGCCAKAVRTLWSLQLPVEVRSHISGMDFNVNTYRGVFEAADKVYLSTKHTDVSAGVAAVKLAANPESGADSAQPGAQVAAVKPARGRNKPNRGRGRGARQSGTGRGGGSSSSNTGASSSGSGRGPRHHSSPPSSCCDNHYRWGSDSWFCLEPLSCPWKDKVSAKKN